MYKCSVKWYRRIRIYKYNTNTNPVQMNSDRDLKNKLEKEGEQKVADLIKTNNVNEKTLVNIIENGNDEFKQIYGRNMTYSEMRSIYG